ncbi:hypothetical protein AVEN_242332-1 [Araneus ventricosus]|uniref:DDE-1 domain-containing protein n=1 Tax=Araneus ventricosus TaxID=182803 RepID=A0A4Y2IEK2_ARAVE|nr:hypothetical protein AVEN_242332-1 [Araneus ventricosus]
MDQGVIQNFKIHYRKRIVRNVITALENNQSMPKINLRQSISEISKTWNYDVTDRTILNSFAKIRFFVSNENSGNTEEEDDIPLEELKKIWIQLREKEEINDDELIDNFLSLDSGAETSETITQLDILDSVTDKKSCDEDEDDEDGNDHDAEINKTSCDQMLKSFETIRSELQFEENTPKGVFGALQRCETYYERKHFFKQKNSDKFSRLLSVIKFKDACANNKRLLDNIRPLHAVSVLIRWFFILSANC